jgi:uncharacterized membrane protein
MMSFSTIRGGLVWVICMLCPMLCSATPGSFEFFAVPGAINLVPYSMNAALNVTGSFSLADGSQHGFLRTGCGKVTRFDVGALTTQPIRINSGGEIAGTYSDVSGFDQGFVRLPNGAVAKFNLGGSGGSTEVTDINDNGTVVGIYSTTNSFPPSQAYFRTRNGIVIPFTVPGSTWVYPESINDAGQITGFYLSGNGVGGFVRLPDSTMTVFESSLGIVPLAINLVGTITGWYTSPSGDFVPFLRQSDGTITRFQVPGMLLTQAMDINQTGVIAGSYTTLNRNNPPDMGTHGFMRTPQGAVGSFDVPGASLTLLTALNDRNVATGYSEGPAGVQGFLLIPGGLFSQ